jgi:phosphoglycolate phosphatase
VIALDLDGTLIDARVRQVGVASEALAELAGRELNEMRFWQAKRRGATTREALEELGYSPGTVAAVARRWMERIESEDWLRRDRALRGTRGVLADLRQDGVVIVVLTARRSAEGARLSLRSAGIEEDIDTLFVVDPVGAVAGKARALRRCRAAAFLGDTESDAAAARRAGVPFVALATGQRSRSRLRSLGYEPASSLRAAVAGVVSVSAAGART